jgi:nitrate/nitrite-specific signal transduction histidine kinase
VSADKGLPKEVTREQLMELLADTNKQIRDLRAKLEDYQWVEEALRRRTREMNERVKELDLLYGIAALLKCGDMPEKELIQAIVERLPAAWQQPRFASARIVLDGAEYRTRSFAETPHTQTSPIYYEGKVLGYVQVCYSAHIVPDGEALFLNEEQRLLDTMASWLGEVRERRQSSAANNGSGRGDEVGH